jgi:hypothetical protein
MKTLFAIGAVAALCCAQAQAMDLAPSISVGTTGVGAHLAIPLAQKLDLRVGGNVFDYDYSGTRGSVNYDFQIKLRTVDLLLDLYPLQNGFRVTGGAIYNGNHVDANGKPNIGGSYTLNGHTYSAADAGSIDGRIDFRRFAPYLGIGWGSRPTAKGWSVNADVGAMFQGSAQVSLQNSGCNLPGTTCATLQSDVAVEAASLHDKIDSYSVYPVVRLGAVYRF